MKRRLLTTVVVGSALALCAASAIAPAAARAEESGGTGCFTTTFASRYVWRGQVLSDGLVIQPAVAITLGGFSADLWTNVDPDGGEPGDGIDMNETDLTLSYTVPAGPVSVTAGIAHYDFEDGDTQDVFLTCALATLLNPSLSLYYDIDDGAGGFAVLELSQDFPAGPVSLSAGASAGFNFGNASMGLNAAGEDFTGPYYAEVSLATSIPLFGGVTLDPRVAYSTALGDDAEEAIGAISDGGRTDILYGSIAVTAAF